RQRPAERLEQIDQQPPVGAPHSLRTQFDDAIDSVEGAEHLELVIERQDCRTKTHSASPHYASFKAGGRRAPSRAPRVIYKMWPRGRANPTSPGHPRPGPLAPAA